MLSALTQKLLSDAKPRGWVLEPDAKQIMREAGLSVPEFRFAQTSDAALDAAHELGYPLVAKVVSPAVLHKTEVKGVAVGIDSDTALTDVVARFSQIKDFAGVHLEKMAGGIELIVGAKIDDQFGPVILMGLGGTGVEIYQDVAIRMAPLAQVDVKSMIDSLKGRKLLEGYRGAEAVNRMKLTQTLLNFSKLVMEIQDDIESIDLNPVLCSAQACVVADARIILKQG
ncbi:acetate--CoA ligase family protein [Desulfosarcina variabilis]|uniref:acetate--CoA ligase family protein n=1 Tax=Desulfosarcina variabilis TaxID=2300 RepID=UPI003AFAD6B6